MAWKEQKKGGVVGRKASREKRGRGVGGGGVLYFSLQAPSPFFPPPSPFDSCHTVVSYMHMLQMSLPLE